MSIKVLHTGDIHLGSFPGLITNKGENARFLDICKCIEALIDGAEKHRPDIAIIAGDIFNQAKVWSDRGLKESQYIIRTLRKLEMICPVVVMRGTPNHDSIEQFNALQTAFDGDDRVHIITEPSIETYQSYTGKKVQIACVPGFDRGYYRAKNPGLSKEEENEVFTTAIANIIIGLKAQCEKNIPSVLVGHYTITGCNMESGQTAFLSQFEPVVYPETLKAADYDLVCFGHIHRPQMIDCCKNTFYCGAISALNFNDEGQERGYYIHEIEDDGEVNSTFYKLPTREFKTIRLDDEDIEAINNGEIDWLLESSDCSDFPEKIVRVLYNCTDEHNKAFNHTALEYYLYANGACYVQEITPQKITITVDRNKLEADDTPEANLVSYLTERSIKPERIGEIVELARPIISESMEKSVIKRRTGAFIPVEIEVKNYRNYRSETFNYNSIRFCTINGQNGVGKSSLFMDAMIDCLFEEPREGELTGWICNAPDARSGSIKFTFKLGDSLYRITRTRQKSGKATLNIAEMADGEWEDRSKEKYRDTQKEIENILGMDSLTLKSCALIMQDQYGLFLQADKEARMNILGNILGLGIYSTMEDLASDKLTDTNRTIKTYSDKVDILMSGLPDMEKLYEEIDYHESYSNGLREEIKEKDKLSDSLKVTLNTQLAATERVIKLNSRISTLTGNKALKEGKKTTQAAIIAGADNVLAEESAIISGVQHYNELCQQEKEFIAVESEYRTIVSKHDQAKSILVENEITAKEARNKKAVIALTKIEPLKAVLERESEITEKHVQYSEIKAQIAAMESLEEEYMAKSEAVKKASEKLLDLKKAVTDSENEIKTKIAFLEQKAIMLDNSGCPNVENATCRFLKDAQEAKAVLPELRIKLNEAVNINFDMIQAATRMLTIAQEELGKVLYNPNALLALRTNLRALEDYETQHAKMESVRKEITLFEERQQELEEIIDNAEKKAEATKSEIVILEQQIKAIAEKVAGLSTLRDEIAVARQWIDKEKQIPLAKEKKSVASSRLFELIAEIESIDSEIAECKQELEKEKSAIVGTEELKIQIAGLEGEIKALQESEQDTAIKIGGLKKQKEQAEESLKKIDELQKQINALAITAAGYDELKKAFSQDGIPHNIIRSIVPIFEATATNILGQMSGGKMSVEFVTEKLLKSNNKKEVTTLDIIINDSDTGRLPYMSRSGGERVKAALSVILALAEIKSSKVGIQLGFLFIDEPPFLDQEGVQAYCDALETIQSRYSELKIMAITHDPAMKARFPQSLDVVKTPMGSKVIY